MPNQPHALNFEGMSNATPENIERVLALIEAGSSEREACTEVGINRGTFRSAALRYAMADQYARATEALARDQVEKLETTIEELRSGDISPEVAKIEIDARKWIASKLFKPTWGDKVALDHAGALDVRATVDVGGLTEEQLATLAGIPTATTPSR